MAKKAPKTVTKVSAKLREDAERAVRENQDTLNQKNQAKDINSLVHELQVYQIELDRQNEALRLANKKLEAGHEKLTGLFEVAPVIYLTVNGFGVIADINTAGLALLNIALKNIINKPLKDFIIPEERESLRDFLEAVFINKTKQTATFTLVKPDGNYMYTQAAGIISGMDKNTFDQCYIALVDVTAYKMIEIKRRQLEEEAFELKRDDDKRVLSAILQAGENERWRISESLHNSLGQLLYGLKLNLEQLDIPKDAYKNVGLLLEEAIRTTRNISFELAPAILQDFGLTVTLIEMGHRLNSSHLSIHVTENNNLRFGLENEANIFRMIQELVNNSIKHGAAKNISIDLNKESNRLMIRVSDDGCGFDPQLVQSLVSGSGFAGIRNRLSLYNGHMHIDSAPGKGAVVLLSLDFK